MNKLFSDDDGHFWFVWMCANVWAFLFVLLVLHLVSLKFHFKRNAMESSVIFISLFPPFLFLSPCISLSPLRFPTLLPSFLPSPPPLSLFIQRSVCATLKIIKQVCVLTRKVFDKSAPDATVSIIVKVLGCPIYGCIGILYK